MKFLIAGFGSIGKRHFRNLLALGERDFIFYRSRLGTIPDHEIREYPVETEISKALDQRPDVVLVTNPTALHLDVAIPAAERGCHLFLEKPLSHSMEGIERFQEIVTNSGSKVLVGFQFRYHPLLIQIKNLLTEQSIGNLISVRAEWGEYLPDWHPWEDYQKGYSARRDLGGGVVLTLCHPIDYLHWLIGEVCSLWSFSEEVDSLEVDVEAVVEIGLRFANGVIGSIHLDYLQKPNVHSLVIVGTKGKILWDYVQGTLRVFKENKNTPESYPLPVGFNRDAMFRDQMAHLRDIVKNDFTPRCTIQDGIYTQKLILGIQQSAATQRIFRM
jgi:predicted dehydrogenase